jgi:hypothetical protein
MFKRTPKILSKFGFWQGAASTFDLFGRSFDPEVFALDERTDAEALASDWEAIGRDFEAAINQFRKDQEAIEAYFR